jgi:hypothetical protein
MKVAWREMPGKSVEHDPSRRERCDLGYWALSATSRQCPFSSTDHTVPSGTGSQWDFPGISCLATFFLSLRDNSVTSGSRIEELGFKLVCALRLSLEMVRDKLFVG